MIMMINRNYKIPKIIIKMNKKYKITKILIRENKILILIVKRKKKYKIKKIIIKMNKKNKITKIIIMVKGKISEDVAFIVDLIQLELNLILGKCVVEFDPAGESVALYSADHVLFHHAQDLHCADRLPLERPLYFLAQLVKELLLIEFLGNARVCKRMRQFLLNELQHVNHVALVFRLSQMRRIVIQIQVVNRLWPLQDVLHQVLVLARTIQSIARYLFRQVII